MFVDEGDLIVKQKYGECKKRVLRLNVQNIKILLDEWDELLATAKDAREDKEANMEVPLGNRIKVATSSDYPNLNFRRFRHPTWTGDSFPSDHGFVLQKEDFALFESNLRCLLSQ